MTDARGCQTRARRHGPTDFDPGRELRSANSTLAAHPTRALIKGREELGQRHTERADDLCQRADVNVSFAALNVADRIAVQAGVFGERFLRTPTALAQLANPATDDDSDMTRHRSYLSSCTICCLHNVLCIAPERR